MFQKMSDSEAKVEMVDAQNKRRKRRVKNTVEPQNRTAQTQTQKFSQLSIKTSELIDSNMNNLNKFNINDEKIKDIREFTQKVSAQTQNKIGADDLSMRGQKIFSDAKNRIAQIEQKFSETLEKMGRELTNMRNDYLRELDELSIEFNNTCAVRENTSKINNGKKVFPEIHENSRKFPINPNITNGISDHAQNNKVEKIVVSNRVDKNENSEQLPNIIENVRNPINIPNDSDSIRPPIVSDNIRAPKNTDKINENQKSVKKCAINNDKKNLDINLNNNDNIDDFSDKEKKKCNIVNVSTYNKKEITVNSNGKPVIGYDPRTILLETMRKHLEGY